MQKAIDDFRRYWRLIFFLPVIAAAVCLVDFGGRPTTGDFWFASLALLYFAACMFRIAIGAAPLLQAMAPTRPPEPETMEYYGT